MNAVKKIVKKALRKYCPNIPALRKKLNAEKIREVNRYRMESEDIRAGEASPEEQTKIVARYSQKWPGYTRKLEEKFQEYLSRCAPLQQRKDLDALKNQVLFVCLAYGFLPDEYFAYELEGKTPQQWRSYFSNRDVSNLVYHVNDIIDLDILFDKYRTYQKYQKYFRRDAISVEKKSDYSAFCSFVQKHPIFVQKNVALSKGDSVELIDSKNCGSSLQILFDKMVSQGKYIVEELVVQSAVMSCLNPSSVNTVRCITFGTKSGIVVGPCFLKVGQGNSFVDNGGKGGILIGIDRQTGKLDTFGYDEFLKEYQRHPDTDVEFLGYQLPDWEQMKKLAVEMSAQTPSIRYIGWDFAHTENGWVVIEGNGSSQMIGPQIVWKRGFKEDIEKLMF